MRVETDLLGVINAKAAPGAVLQRKYILRVTSEQLGQWLQFDRKSRAKSSPFRISPHSLIRIDEDIQRGRDASGFLLQNVTKIMEIATTLLNPPSAIVPRLYLGSLIWNVRPVPGSDTDEFFSIQKVEEANKPPRYRLAFDAESIYLTDSAHRHLGIVEAYRQYITSPEKFPSFDPKAEFSVELYTLNKTRERELFSELNAKQKKISSAKQKQMDVSSPIGALKDAILDYDRGSARFFYNNIEVSSNQNDKHTLLTMSVFQLSIQEMFSPREIRDSREDEELKYDLAEFYCEYFYELASTIVVRADIGNGEQEYHPFRNLYCEILEPVANSADPSQPSVAEEKFQMARERATAENRQLRRVDVVNHNSFIKALSRLGRFIRRMDNWREVIARLQSQHNLRCGGKLFQVDNAELMDVNPRLGVSIATLNEDGTLNVQVQTKTINAIYEYLLTTLRLNRSFSVLQSGAGTSPLYLPKDFACHHTIPGDSSSYSCFTALFFLPRSIGDLGENSVRMDIDGGQDWPVVTRKGKGKSLTPSACEPDSSYADEEFEDIVRWRATFEVKWPTGYGLKDGSADVVLKFWFPRFDDPAEIDSESRRIQVSRVSV